VFFNLFSEAEPVAAILIPHGTHSFSGGGAPEARRAKIRGRRPRAGVEVFLWSGQRALTTNTFCTY